MKKRQINAEIEYRLSKWMAYNMLQEGFISVEEYQTACSEFLKRYNPPTSCIEKNENRKD